GTTSNGGLEWPMPAVSSGPRVSARNLGMDLDGGNRLGAVLRSPAHWRARATAGIQCRVPRWTPFAGGQASRPPRRDSDAGVGTRLRARRHRHDGGQGAPTEAGWAESGRWSRLAPRRVGRWHRRPDVVAEPLGRLARARPPPAPPPMGATGAPRR